MMHQLDLQRVKEAFHNGIVPAVSLTAHRADDAVICEQPLIVTGCILNATIGMMQQPAGRFAPPQRHRERLGRQLWVASAMIANFSWIVRIRRGARSTLDSPEPLLIEVSI